MARRVRQVAFRTTFAIPANIGGRPPHLVDTRPVCRMDGRLGGASGWAVRRSPGVSILGHAVGGCLDRPVEERRAMPFSEAD